MAPIAFDLHRYNQKGQEDYGGQQRDVLEVQVQPPRHVFSFFVWKLRPTKTFFSSPLM
jgi:hypothetical protein